MAVFVVEAGRITFRADGEKMTLRRDGRDRADHRQGLENECLRVLQRAHDRRRLPDIGAAPDPHVRGPNQSP